MLLTMCPSIAYSGISVSNNNLLKKIREIATMNIYSEAIVLNWFMDINAGGLISLKTVHMGVLDIHFSLLPLRYLPNLSEFPFFLSILF